MSPLHLNSKIAIYLGLAMIVPVINQLQPDDSDSRMLLNPYLRRFFKCSLRVINEAKSFFIHESSRSSFEFEFPRQANKLLAVQSKGFNFIYQCLIKHKYIYAVVQLIYILE